MLPLTTLLLALQLSLASVPVLVPAAARRAADSLAVLVGPIEPAGAARGQSVRGIAELFPDAPGRALLVLRLARGTPGAGHAFQLWRGPCGDDRELLPVEAPAIARLDDYGRGKAVEAVIIDLPESGPLHVVIRRGTAADGPAAGCAELRDH